jgi:hypothetical protein
LFTADRLPKDWVYTTALNFFPPTRHLTNKKELREIKHCGLEGKEPGRQLETGVIYKE